MLLSAQADDLDWFARELACMPFDFEILTPAALRRAVAACGQRLHRLVAAAHP